MPLLAKVFLPLLLAATVVSGTRISSLEDGKSSGRASLIWPVPKKMEIGRKGHVVHLASNFAFVPVKPLGSNAAVPSTLLEGMRRYESLLHQKISLSTVQKLGRVQRIPACVR